MDGVFTPIKVGTFEITSPLGIGAGAIKNTKDLLLALGMSDAGFVKFGSVTFSSRMGNSGQTYYLDPEKIFSVNALGLPNPGIDEATRIISQAEKEQRKKIILSSAGMTPSEHVAITMAISPLVNTVVENLGCPNIWNDEGQKRIQSYNPSFIEELLKKLSKEKEEFQQTKGRSLNILLKLSPYYFKEEGVEKIINRMDKILHDAGHFPHFNNQDFWGGSSLPFKVAEIISRYEKVVDGLVVSNTLGNFSIEVKKDGMTKKSHVLDFSSSPDKSEHLHMGGLGGSIMHTLCISQIHGWKKLLPEIPIIASGGITIGVDLVDCVDAGACAGEITTAYLRDASALPEILDKYAQIAPYQRVIERMDY